MEEVPIPESPRALPATEVLIGRIGWLIRLRWVAVAGSLAFIVVARRILSIEVHLPRLLGVLAILALYNLAAELLLRRISRAGANDPEASMGERDGEPIGPVARFLLPRTPPGVEYYDQQAARAALFASTQIVLDLLFLAVLLHYAGGIENPLRVFFIFHVIVASILLSKPATYGVASLGLLLLALVASGELWGVVPHYSLEGHWRSQGYLDGGLVGTQVFLLGVTLFVGAYLASSIAARLRRRELDVAVLTRHLEGKARRLEEAYWELSVAERAKSEYMRKVAHELRQPLGTVKTALSVALDSAPDSMSDRARGLIERAERRAGELAEMTRELLSLALARGGEALVESVPMNLEEIARGVLDEMAARSDEAGISLSVQVEEGLPRIMGSPGGMGDLIRNLLGNALRYTPRGGAVSFAMREEAGDVVLEVGDTGIGIEEEALGRIFDEFYRSDSARAHAPEGSGLGMAIVRAVVDQHQGRISVESEVGRGTRFRVELPVVVGGGHGTGSKEWHARERGNGNHGHPGAGRKTMNEISFGDRSYRVDSLGFLMDPGEWDEDFAEGMAPMIGISGGLTDRHWEVIRYIRDEFRERGDCPLVFSTCRAKGLSLRELESLFPAGYLRGACKLAGITYRDRFVDFFGERGRPTSPGVGAKAARAPEGGPAVAREKVYRVDVLGFLVDPAEWDEGYAAHRAWEMKLPGGLTDRHWQVIEYLRMTFDRTGSVPTVPECCDDLGMDLNQLERLFPDGYHRGAVKLAGLCVRPGGMEPPSLP
jgi:tRNA 2-thiouridine synthesizing protein E